MSTRVGLIVEGPIDHLLVSALLERIAADRADFSWPVTPQDVADIIPIRKRGDGGVLDTVRKLIRYLDRRPDEYAFFVVVLDRRTRPVQEKIRRIIRGKSRFLLAIAREEIEAWWLGDRTSTLTWLRLEANALAHTRYGARGYKAERDPAPKRTLDELTRESDAVDQTYGQGNTELARRFTEQLWREHACLDEIEQQCPRGFKPFCRKATQALRAEKTRQARLF